MNALRESQEVKSGRNDSIEVRSGIKRQNTMQTTTRLDGEEMKNMGPADLHSASGRRQPMEGVPVKPRSTDPMMVVG